MILAVVLVGGFSIPVFAEEATTASPPATSKEESTPEASKKEIQGPAVSAPREILQMLEQRKRDLDKREAALRGSEMHLLELKAELEEIVTRHEQAVEAEKKRRQAAQAKATTEAEKSKTSAKPGGAANVNQAQLTKIYEAMPAEEAAARLERMPDRKAVEVLRLLKGKSAGAILSEVKPDRAARLTEQLLTAP
jgi:flagellar motility protein MotE (MotC chaperone)